MTGINFKEQFAGPVEAGTKRQTIRQAKCSDRYCERYKNQECDGTFCDFYEHRIKPGDTLQLYTGMMQRKYCKTGGIIERGSSGDKFYCNDFSANDKRCHQSIWPKKHVKKGCIHRGAKLLKTATCTESFPIKFEDLTEEIARLDGFEDNMIAIHPRETWSQTDGQRHFISAPQIANLYGVNLKHPNVMVWDERRPETTMGLNPNDFIHLHPSYSGNYPKISITALQQLKDFLIKTYDAKDGDVFQVIRWKA